MGNNYRWRWDLAAEPLAYTTGSQYTFAFRYSTDGVSWYRIALGAGPSGGTARTVQRAFQPPRVEGVSTGVLALRRPPWNLCPRGMAGARLGFLQQARGDARS